MYRRFTKILASASILLIIVVAVFLAGLSFLFSDIKPVSLTPEDRGVMVYGSKIRYRIYKRHTVEGSPKTNELTIILLHGFRGSLDHWDDVAPLLQAHRVIALDMVGFGGSDRPQISYDLDTQRTYLLQFMKELKVEKSVLVGISMGASVATWTAAKSKQEIAGAVVIAPSGYPGSLKKSWPYSSFYKPGLLNMMAERIVRWPVYRLFFPNNLGPQTLGVTGSYNGKFAEALADIHQPILLVWSPSDDTSMYDYHIKYKESIRNLEFIKTSDKLGHDIVRKDPAGTAAFINDFMNNVMKKV